MRHRGGGRSRSRPVLVLAAGLVVASAVLVFPSARAEADEPPSHGVSANHECESG